MSTQNSHQTDQEESSQQTPSYKREDSVAKTQQVKENFEEIKDRFILDSPGKHVGDTIDDDREIRKCIATAAEYFHNNLPQHIRNNITDKWGITNKSIDARKIGYVDGSNRVVTHLREHGFDDLTIVRAGIGTETTIKHLLECNGVSNYNASLVEDSHKEAEVGSCYHDVDETIETLLRAQLQGFISPHEIDLEAVATYLIEDCTKDTYDDNQLNIYNWWDNRIVFPYLNDDNEVVYFIVRSTEDTDDIVYSNGVIDRSDTKKTTLENTNLGRELSSRGEIPRERLMEYTVLPKISNVFNNPDSDETQTEKEAIVDLLQAEETRPDALIEYGLLHESDDTISPDTAPIRVFDSEILTGSFDTEYVITSPATGVNPGDVVSFINHTDAGITVTPHGETRHQQQSLERQSSATPGTPTGELTYTFNDSGMYKFEVTVDGEQHHVMVLSYNDIYTDSRNEDIETWLDDEPLFDIDIAKYIKQTVDRDWISDVISEPIFGMETASGDMPLLITEGVTDALVAHQNGIPCIAPATTNFKQHHYDTITNLDTKKVFIVNDNEVNNAGINGALRTGRVLEEAGKTVYVGELPRPDDVRKIDVAEYLKSHTRSDMISDVLNQAVTPQQHPLYDPSIHDPTEDTSSDTRRETGSSGSYTTSSDDDTTYKTNSSRSALYDLTLEDVIDFDALEYSNRSGDTFYRGVNPIEHHGDSTGYFVMDDKEDHIIAKDYKISTKTDHYKYNALTWLACAADCECDADKHCTCTRTVRNPQGSLSNGEVWWAWRYAKTASHIPFPDDDRVPVKALWFLAEYHDLLPSEYIPTSFEDDKRLPPTTYNDVLDIIESEYGLEHNREKLHTT